MGKQETPTPKERFFAQMSEESLGHLNAISAELDEAQKDLEALDKLGMDTSILKSRLDWGRKAVEVIGERFADKQE